MKYTSNSLEDIYIHDTNLDQFGYQDNECIFIVSDFCIKSSCKANPNGVDMHITEGLIRFKNIHFKEILCESEVIQLILSFESVSIQWNAFDGKAWYVK